MLFVDRNVSLFFFSFLLQAAVGEPDDLSVRSNPQITEIVASIVMGDLQELEEVRFS